MMTRVPATHRDKRKIPEHGNELHVPNIPCDIKTLNALVRWQELMMTLLSHTCSTIANEKCARLRRKIMPFSVVYSVYSKSSSMVKVILNRANYIRALVEIVSPKHNDMYQSFSRLYRLTQSSAVQA